MSTGGPFRHDATVERRVACASPEDFVAVADTLGGGVGLSGFGFALALAATTIAEALWTFEPLAFAASALLGGTAFLMLKRERAAATGAAKRRAAAPSHCAFTADGCVLEGAFGSSTSRYEAIRAIGAVPGWVVFVLDEGLVVLRSEPDLEPWIAARAPQAARTLPNWSRPRRALLALALAYPVAVASALVAVG